MCTVGMKGHRLTWMSFPWGVTDRARKRFPSLALRALSCSNAGPRRCALLGIAVDSAKGEVRLVRITRFVVLGLLVAASASAVALAVDKQGGATQTNKEDGADPTVTVKGVLHTTADGYAVGSRSVSFGPPWYAARSPLIKDRLGTSVTVTGSADDSDDELSVRTIDGVTYRAEGRPPWAGDPSTAEPRRRRAKRRQRRRRRRQGQEGRRRQDGKGRRRQRRPAALGESLRASL